MTSKVFVRFINENQWVDLCSEMASGEAFSVSEDLYVEWSSADLDGTVSDSQIVPFTEFVDQLNNRWPNSYQYGISLLISGANVITTDVTIPSKQTRQIAQAVPYMIEDQLAQDVSQLHLIMGARQSDGELPVVAIPKLLIEHTRELFDQYHLPLDSVLPDMLCLPHRDGEWTLLFDGKHMLVKRGEYEGLAIEMDAAPVVLASIMEHWEPKPGLLRILFCMEHLNENVKNWIKTQVSGQIADAEFEVEYEEVNSSDFQLMCDQLQRTATTKKPSFDLLQGRYASSGRRKPSGLNWKPLAALIAMFVVMYTAFLHTQAWQMNQEAQRLDGETKTLYKKLFPRDKRIVNVQRQMEQHIKTYQRGGQGDSFMALLALAGEQIYTVNRSEKEAISPRRVAYDDGQGDLRLDLMVKDFGQLESFKNKLQQASLNVETASATQDKEGVKARLKIRGERS